MEQGEPGPLALEVDDQDPVQVWRMRLRPVNAVNGDMLDALDAAISAAESSESVAAVVLTSGLRIFSAGADATWMADTVSRRGPQGLLAEFNETMDRFRAICIRLREAPFLVIAAVRGHAIAGGLELAAACDLRFCSNDEHVRLGVPEMDLFGCLPSGGGGAQFLTRLLGPSKALEYMLDAKPVSPATALSIGLVSRLYADDEVESAALQFASDVARKAGRRGISGAKTAVFTAGELPLAAAMQVDGLVHWDNMRRGNFLRGVESFTSQYASRGGA